MFYSVNKKLNSVLNEIEEQMMYNMSFNDIERYMKAFPKESDYNIAMYGNLLNYYSDVKKMYRDAGYKSLDKMSDQKVWEIYKRQVGYVARCLTNKN